MTAADEGGIVAPLPERVTPRWSWLLTPVAVAVGSRAFSIALMAAIAANRGIAVMTQLTTWDGSWYARIAIYGYHGLPVDGIHYDFAFFPAWPMLMRILSLGLLPPGIVGFVAANVLFVIGAVLAWRLLADRWDETVATGALLLLSFSPPAYTFSMVYSESLFLVAVAGSLMARSKWLAAAFGTIAGATRLAGLAIVAAGGAATSAAREQRRLLIWAAIGAIVGFALWFLYIAILTGHPLGFFEGSRSWLRFNVIRTQLHAVHLHIVEYAARFAYVGLVVLGSALAFRHDRQLGLFALATVGIAILSVTSVPVQSIARYAMPAFPAYAPISDRLGRRRTIALVIVFAVAEVWFASWTIGPPRISP